MTTLQALGQAVSAFVEATNNNVKPLDKFSAAVEKVRICGGFWFCCDCDSGLLDGVPR